MRGERGEIREVEGAERTRFARAVIWAIACVLAVRPGVARAQAVMDQPSSPIDEARPWAAGVAATEQAVALELYVAGNHEFAEARFAQALTKYREALRHWDHPAIHFNIAVCLINLDQPVEAHDHLERSLAYGERAVGPDAYGQGLTYRKLLDAQLARVTITCAQPGTTVSLDGKSLLTGPGTTHRLVLPGEHQIVATKVGFFTHSSTLVLVAGKATSYDVRLIALVIAPNLVRRWPAWLPWAVVFGGGAMAAGGGWSYVAAERDFKRYDDGIAARCGRRCSAEMLAGFTDLRRIEDRASVEQVAAFSLLAAGGLAVITGVAGLIANQPRARSQPGAAGPLVAPTAGGVTVIMRWSF